MISPKDPWDVRGIVTVLNTPLTADNQIDIASLKRSVRRAREAEAGGQASPAASCDGPHRFNRWARSLEEGPRVFSNQGKGLLFSENL